MKTEDVKRLMEKHETNELQFNGVCHDCGKPVIVEIEQFEDGSLGVRGGAVYIPKEVSETGENEAKETVIEGAFLKCDECYKFKYALDNFQACEIYSRVVGYLRPTKQWNKAKQTEFKARRLFHTVDI